MKTWKAYSVFNFITKKYQPNPAGGKFYGSRKGAEEWAKRSMHWEVHTFEVRRIPNE